MRRRQLLRWAGLSAAAPFVPWLASRAQGEVAPTRLIIYHQAVGNYGPTVRCSEGASVTLPSSLAALEPFRERLLPLRGVDQAVLSHQGLDNDHPQGAATKLTGQANGDGTQGGGPSVDQVIAARMPTAFPSLHLAFDYWNEGDGLVWSRPGSYVPYLRDSQAAFDVLFGGGLPNAEPPEPMAGPSRRGSVLDVVLGDLARARQRASGNDLRKIEAHTEAIRALEMRIASPTIPSAPVDHCSMPTLTDQRDPRTEVNNLLDLSVSALACDLTRVIVLHNGPERFPWLHDSEHHELSHWNSAGLSRNEQRNRMDQISTWHAEQFASLLTKLDERELLDDTVCLWVEEHTTTESDQHGREDTHFMLAGNGGGLRTGRVVSFGGRPHNDLLISLCHLMGLTDVESIGVDALCNGGLPGLL